MTSEEIARRSSDVIAPIRFEFSVHLAISDFTFLTKYFIVSCLFISYAATSLFLVMRCGVLFAV